jgi:hypothetical protein
MLHSLRNCGIGHSDLDSESGFFHIDMNQLYLRTVLQYYCTVVQMMNEYHLF